MIKLIQGDCLKRMDELIHLGFKFDMILTDPPYGTTACKWDSIIPLEPMWERLKLLIKPNGVVVITASQPFTTTLISSNIKMFKYCWHWEKGKGTGFLNAKKQPIRCIEDAAVFSFLSGTYNPQGLIQGEFNNGRLSKLSTDKGKMYGNQKNSNPSKFSNYPRQLLKFSGVHKPKHPTQKPVALMEYLIKTYTNEGETVLDFTMGSGSTGVAAKNLNRDFIGIELDETYFNIAKERINNS
jgi:site-specific DNA-methyltransferase (adenine-specific)